MSQPENSKQDVPAPEKKKLPIWLLCAAVGFAAALVIQMFPR